MTRCILVNRILHIFQALFVFLVIASCSQEQVLTIGTGGTAGNYDKTGLAIARIVDKEQAAQGLRLQVKSSSGSVANIDAIMAGEIQFGIAQADRQYQAVNGLAEWKGKGPQKGLRSMFSLYTESVTLVAGRDSGISTVGDLKGKRVDIGPSGSGIRQNAIDTLQGTGIDPGKDITVSEEGWDNRVSMLMHGQLDALFHTVGHPSQDILFITSSMRQVRFIPLDNIETLLAKYPYYSKSSIAVKTWYPAADNNKDVQTIGVKATLLTSEKVPDEVVYAITKAVFSNLDALGQNTPILQNLGKEEMVQGLTAPIHPGALRYYNEIGLQVPPSRLTP